MKEAIEPLMKAIAKSCEEEIKKHFKVSLMTPKVYNAHVTDCVQNKVNSLARGARQRNPFKRL